jgi:hypothetical protein
VVPSARILLCTSPPLIIRSLPQDFLSDLP